MAHIVCVTGGFTGILNATLALMQQLHAAGHQVTYASPADQQAFITAHNIDYVQLDPWVIQSGDPPMGRWQKLRSYTVRQQRAIKALGVHSFAENLATLKPDLVLIDIEMHPHIMAAVMANLPVALLCPFFSIWRRPGLPPIHANTIPGKGWHGQPWGMTWSWLRYGWRKWKEYQLDRWRRVGLDRISVLRSYARSVGYPFREQFGGNQWLVPFPHQDIPILCLHAQEMDFPHEPPPTMQYLGPMVADREKALPQTQQIIQDLAPILQSIKNKKKKLIYCGCSSLAKGNRKFLTQVIQAVQKQPDWTLILGLGKRLSVDALGPLPPNVHALTWAPQLYLLRQADCAIINSGPHSITECVHFGVPMLVYSLKRACQNGNSARVKYYGLGIVGDLQMENVNQIREHLQQLLVEPTYRIAVEEMRERTRYYTEQNLAVQAVESLLKQPAEKSVLEAVV